MALSGTNLQNNETYASYIDAINKASYGVDVRMALSKAFSKIAEEVDNATAANATAMDSVIIQTDAAKDRADDAAEALESELNADNPGTLAWKVNQLDGKIATLDSAAEGVKSLVDSMKADSESSDDPDSSYKIMVNRVGTMYNDLYGNSGETGSIAQGIADKTEIQYIEKIDRIEYTKTNGLELSLQNNLYKGYDAILMVLSFVDAHPFLTMKKDGNGKEITGTVTLNPTTVRISNKNYSANLVTQNKPELAYSDMNGWNRYTGQVLLINGQKNTGMVHAKNGMYGSRCWLYNSEAGTITSEAPVVMGVNQDDVPVDGIFEDEVLWGHSRYTGAGIIASGKNKGKVKFWKNNNTSNKNNVTTDFLDIEYYRLANKPKRWHFIVPYLIYGVKGIANGLASMEYTAPTVKYAVYDPSNNGQVLRVSELKPLDTTFYAETTKWREIEGHESEWFYNTTTQTFYKPGSNT